VGLDLRTGNGRGAQRIVFHSPKGIGKTTFAARAPAPVFMGTEDGLGDLDDIPRFPPLTSWEEVKRRVQELLTEDHDRRTLVIDTVDHLERLLHVYICEKASSPKSKCESIEQVGGGFAKGYTYACEEFAWFQRSLDELRTKRGMHIIVLAHSHVKTFNNPDGTNFDRWEPKLQKQAAGLWMEWPDIVLFANIDTDIASTEWKEEKKALAKGKAIGTATRRLYTSISATYDAKNRYGLPPEMALDWKEFATAMRFDEIEARLLGRPLLSADECKKRAWVWWNTVGARVGGNLYTTQAKPTKGAAAEVAEQIAKAKGTYLRAFRHALELPEGASHDDLWNAYKRTQALAPASAAATAMYQSAVDAMTAETPAAVATPTPEEAVTAAK
jgi:hypothetical protein